MDRPPQAHFWYQVLFACHSGAAFEGSGFLDDYNRWVARTSDNHMRCELNTTLNKIGAAHETPGAIDGLDHRAETDVAMQFPTCRDWLTIVIGPLWNPDGYILELLAQGAQRQRCLRHPQQSVMHKGPTQTPQGHLLRPGCRSPNPHGPRKMPPSGVQPLSVGSQLLPFHVLWYMLRSKPSPKISSRLGLQETTVGALVKSPPSACQPVSEGYQPAGDHAL